jgi:hypothetical protein
VEFNATSPLHYGGGIMESEWLYGGKAVVYDLVTPCSLVDGHDVSEERVALRIMDKGDT